MQTSVHNAFGFVVAITKFAKDEIVTMDPVVDNLISVDATFRFIWYNISGSSVLVNQQTGERLVREQGSCTLTDPEPHGSWRLEIPEDLEVLCVSPFMNSDKLPLSAHFAKFYLSANEQTVVPQGAQLFLGRGDLLIEDKVLSGPRQIRFSSSEKTVVAQTDCYGLMVT